MKDVIESYDLLKSKMDIIENLGKEADSIEQEFVENDLDIDEYRDKSTLSLLVIELFAFMILIVIAGILIFISTLIGLVWLVGILLGLVLLGFLILYFKPVAIIAIICCSVVYLDIIEPEDALYLCIGLFLAYRLISIYSRKKKANKIIKNENSISKLILEIKTILKNELVPIAHHKYIVSIETIMDDTDINFLPEHVVEQVFNHECTKGNFEKILALNLQGNEQQENTRKSQIFKSLINLTPSNDNVEITELDIS